jgi:hypothetical protein
MSKINSGNIFRDTRAAQWACLRKPEGLDPDHTFAMEEMTACKCAGYRLIQRLQAHCAFLTRNCNTLQLAGFSWFRIKRMSILWNHATLDQLAIAHRHTKPLMLTFLPVLPLAGLAAVENKLATGAYLEQQVRAVAGADTAVGALSLVACGGLAGTGEGRARRRPRRSRSQTLEKIHDICMATLRSYIN